MNTNGIVWAELKDAPTLERTELFRVPPLWEDQNGVAKAMVVEIDPEVFIPGLMYTNLGLKKFTLSPAL